MKASFGIAREKNNRLFYKEYTNDKGLCHFHSQIELYFVDDGEMEAIVNDKRRLLTKGQMSVALSYDAHAYRTPEYSKSSTFIIPAFMCTDFVESVKGKRAIYPFILNDETVKKIKDCIKEINKPDINPISLSGYIHIILGEILDRLGFEETQRNIDTDFASRLLLYINENFTSDISLKTLSCEFGYSESYISRFFKENFNTGLNQYINMLKLKNTLLLMSENKHNITYCAFESGFTSMRTFYRVFYNEFGCTPKQYMEVNI